MASLSGDSETIVDHFLRHPEKVHFTFDHGNGHSREYPGLQLASEAAGLALRFRELGVKPGDRVAVVVPTSEPLLRTIVAAWFCRAAIVVLPHRLGGTHSSGSAEKVTRMLDKVAPTVVVGYAAVEDSIRPSLGAQKHYVPAESMDEVPSASLESIDRPTVDDLAVLQFSSGSTQDPRAVIVRHGQLMANTTSSGFGAGLNGDAIALWLPLYHDFGMLGAIYFPLAFGLSVSLMPTEAFIAAPVEWLRLIEKHQSTLAAIPPFALGIIAEAAASLPVGAIDLSSLQYISLGSEPIFHNRVMRARAVLERQGLSARAFQSAYGMAEAVAGITNSERGGEMRVLTCDVNAWRKTGLVVAGGTGMSVVGCGRAIDEMVIRVVNDDGSDIPQPHRGRIWIKGPSVTEGYWGESESPLKDGWLDTGDEGFLLEGQLYVCGRTKDTLIRGGVNFDAHEIEDAVEQALAALAPELRCRASAVFAVRDDLHQRERAVAVLEVKRRPEDADALFNSMRLAVLERTGLGLDDIAYALPPGLPRTTSGKLQRGRAREMFEAGSFPYER